MRRVAAKFVPRFLTDEQRERRLRACLELQDQLKEDPEFFSKVITGDESWCYGGVVHAEFVPSGQTVNQQFYLDVLKRLREKIRKKRADLWRTGDWFFHHDNEPAHTALSIRQFLTKNGMTPIVHPPYSPNLAPCDFFLFPRLKRDMKGKRFATVEEEVVYTRTANVGTNRPSLGYCSHLWGCASKHRLKLLDSIQNRADRLIDAPNLTKDLHRAVRTRNTREALLAHPYQAEVPTSRTSLLQYSFFWKTSTLWNELPGSLFPDGYNLQRFHDVSGLVDNAGDTDSEDEWDYIKGEEADKENTPPRANKRVS
nr:unnamed protein product [Callosobruchus analis]